jgi:transcriptional regulator GlxA family with amidase domain
MLVIWGPEQCRVHAADWHDGQISHNTHSKIARRAADPISACRYRKPRWVRDNIARDFAIQELAEAVALAPRTFARRVAATCGVSPIQFVQQIRLETALFLLETTRLSVEQIARQVGYAEPSTLRRLIRRGTRHSPGHFRPVARVVFFAFAPRVLCHRR